MSSRLFVIRKVEIYIFSVTFGCLAELCDVSERERRCTHECNALYSCQAVQLITTRLCILTPLCSYPSAVFGIGPMTIHLHCIRGGGEMMGRFSQ
jgi:hypothetical protein